MYVLIHLFWGTMQQFRHVDLNRIVALRFDRQSREALFLSRDDLCHFNEEGHQIVARYVDASGQPTQAWPANPNGSPGAIAGICDPSGRLFGLMPHPDAYLYPFQHPQWSRKRYSGRVAIEGGGLSIFRNGVAAVLERLTAATSESPANSSHGVD